MEKIAKKYTVTGRIHYDKKEKKMEAEGSDSEVEEKMEGDIDFEVPAELDINEGNIQESAIFDENLNNDDKASAFKRFIGA